MKFDWIEDGVLAASPLPTSDADIQSLYDQGVRAIVTLTERSLTAQGRISPALFGKLDIATLHVPIDDLRAPTNEQADEVSAFIDLMKAEGQPVLLHCKVGQGRTGTLLHAYYLTKGYSLPDARYQVSLKRPLCDFNSLSDVQRTFLEAYAAMGRTIYV